MTAPALSVPVGSLAAVTLPEPLSAVTEVEGPLSGAPEGLTAVVEEGTIAFAAARSTVPQTATVTVRGLGCSGSECGRPFVMIVSVAVTPIAAPPGPLEALTEPSPDRADEADNHALTDELMITVGSPESPGTRAQADVAAAAAGGLVAGGFEDSGIYQLRWTSHQDLSERTADLEAQSAVTSVSPSTVGLYGATSAYPVAEEFDSPLWTWPYEQVHASQAWAKTTGSSTTVGIIDVGNAYVRHEDLNVTEVVGSYKPQFHATHVAGLACAAPNGVGMVGMAWGCPVVTETRGLGAFTPSVLASMQMMARRPNVKVVNVSLGFNAGGCATETTQHELEDLVKAEKGYFNQFLAGPGKNIVWTFSAGNNCAPGAASPWGADSQLPNVVTVAATNSDSTLATFSNFGFGVEVAAPGGVAVEPQSDGLMSTGVDFSTDKDCPQFDACLQGVFGTARAALCHLVFVYCGIYGQDRGTSMAAPVVAGIAALVRQQHPGLSASEAGACITSSAGTGGTGYTLGRSDQPDDAFYHAVHYLPYTGPPTPIVNAASAVDCDSRSTASSYAGSGGGDGWAIALTQEAVYNVFHHSETLQLACHLQADASPCWSPETITDDEGHGFATSGQPGLWMDQASGRLYVFGTRTSDRTAGVVCIDTTRAAVNPDPFCGFTALTGSGEAVSGISGVSDPAKVGSRWYAFNYVPGTGVTGSENKLLCFDLNKLSACNGQPLAVAAPSGNDLDAVYPPPAVVAIGSKIIVPLRFEGGERLSCLDGNTQSACEGVWPVPIVGYGSQYGAAYPLLAGGGNINGFCLPTGIDPCYSLDGASVDTPHGMPEAISASSGWNGPSLVRGTRVYVPNGNFGQVDCFDYSMSSSCQAFPLFLENLALLYTVNPDPERPNCIWANSDSGAWQIQNFDANTGNGCE